MVLTSTNLPVAPKAGQTWTVYLVESNDASIPPPSTSKTYAGRLSPPLRRISRQINGLAGFESSASGDFLTIKRPDQPWWWWWVHDEAPFSVFIVVSEGSATKSVLFIGDFGTSTTREIGIHDSVFTAQDLDTAKWNTSSSTDIANATTLPHVTVMGTGDGNADFYSFRDYPANAAERV